MRAIDVTFVSRRKILGALLFGAGALLSACGAVPPPKSSDNPNASVSDTGQVTSSGGVLGPVAAKSGGADPLAAVVAPASPTPTSVAQAFLSIPPTETPLPTATTVPLPTATAVPTDTPVPTPTTIPYDASRLTDLLGESVTSYAGSIPPRVHNVQLATSLINGATVAPGAVFSFDDRVGDQTTASGFQVAYGIISGTDGPQTVKADAGGICQVATTLFQSVYWAGLPIVRRYHHLYWIAHYGTPPYGLLGLDATVDFAPVDFQFRNTTSDWIRIDASYDPTHVHMRIVGVDQGWKVTAGQPHQFNVVKTDRTVVKQPDPTMNPGRELWIETAEDGFDVTVERLVKTKSGDVVDRYVFTNHYEPARNVMVVGSKGLTATPTTGTTTPVAGTTTPGVVPTTPTPAATLPTVTPTSSGGRLSDGRIQVPSFVGLAEAAAQQQIAGLGLQTTFANYQGPGDVPAAVLNQVGVGAVLSQIPAPGTIVTAGATVYLAIRKA
jgi:vancomycin resistance protein YoaR